MSDHDLREATEKNISIDIPTMLRFDGLSKKITFDDRNACVAESTRSINNSGFNSDKPALSIITLKTQTEIKEYLYPRIDEFHRLKSSNKYALSSNNRFASHPELFANRDLPLYESRDRAATINTINYVFDQFHRGVFVQILDNKIKTFVAINNYESVGFDVMKHIKFDPKKYKNIDDFIEKVNTEHFKRYKLIKRKEDSIYFMGCSVNLWADLTPRGQDVDWLYTYQYHILVELLKVRKVNDIEFILNSKDQTMLVADGESSPHFNILGNLTTPMNRKSKNFIPIINMGSHKKYADLPMPTNDDWEIITNKIFLGLCRNQYINIAAYIDTDYDRKIPTAIFRGGATGCGTLVRTNPRLHAAYLSSKYYNHPKYGIASKDGLYLDARLVSFKKKPKKHYSDKYISIIDPKTLPMKLSKRMPIGEISKYKYIISIEGNIAQFRLTLELSFNSVVLLVRSEYYLWYQPLLKPWVHYVPIKADLSDLMDKIHWCRTHDSKCKIIAANARKFYHTYINEDSVFDYMERLLSFPK